MMRYDDWKTMAVNFYREDQDREREFMCDVQWDNDLNVTYIGSLEQVNDSDKWELIDSRLTLAPNCTINL